MRRAQMEMIGLVFVVVILILGIFLYVSFSSRTKAPAAATQVQASNSYLTALSETYLPACKVRFSEAARVCAGTGYNPLVCTNPCQELKVAMARIVNATLLREGRKFNLSISGTNVQNESGCPSADSKTRVIAAPQVPIVMLGGPATTLTLALCG